MKNSKYFSIISRPVAIWLLPVLSAALLILAYPPYNLEFLIWISLIPLFWFINLKISPKKVFFGGFLVGVLFFGKLFSWFFATYPFEWLGVIGQKNIALISGLVGFVWLIQTLFLGLFIGFFAWFSKKFLIKKFKKISGILIIPALWIILEYLRVWGFGIFWAGNESFFGAHWTFGNLAYTVHNQITLIQLADLGGIYLLSFLIVFVNFGLFLIFKNRFKPKKAWLIMLILILVGTLWTLYGSYKFHSSYKSTTTYRVALLQTNFLSSPEFNAYSKSEVFNAIIDLFKKPENINYKPDIIISPEGFGIISLTNQKTAKHMLGDFYRPDQVYMENKKIKDQNNKNKSRTFYYQLEKQEPLGYHDKVLLVPGGDYLPYSVKFLLNIYSFNLDYEKRLYQRGEKIEPIKTPKGKIGGTICSSILSPSIQRKMTKDGAEFLAVVSSDAPFHGSNALLDQNLAMAKFRAVENRRYFIQATNMGYSFLLNPKGEIEAKTKEFGNTILNSKIGLLTQKSFYTNFGNWPIALSTIILLLSLVFCYNYRGKPY